MTYKHYNDPEGLDEFSPAWLLSDKQILESDDEKIKKIVPAKKKAVKNHVVHAC